MFQLLRIICRAKMKDLKNHFVIRTQKLSHVTLHIQIFHCVINIKQKYVKAHINLSKWVVTVVCLCLLCYRPMLRESPPDRQTKNKLSFPLIISINVGNTDCLSIHLMQIHTFLVKIVFILFYALYILINVYKILLQCTRLRPCKAHWFSVSCNYQQLKDQNKLIKYIFIFPNDKI